MKSRRKTSVLSEHLEVVFFLKTAMSKLVNQSLIPLSWCVVLVYICSLRVLLFFLKLDTEKHNYSILDTLIGEVDFR